MLLGHLTDYAWAEVRGGSRRSHETFELGRIAPIVAVPLLVGAFFFIRSLQVRVDPAAVAAASASARASARAKIHDRLPIASAAPSPDFDVVVGRNGPRGFAELPELARAKGFFEAEGLRVQVADAKTGGDVVRGVIEGRLGLGLSFDYPIAFEAFTRPNFVIVAMLAHEDSPMTLLARKDRGVAAVSDLKGKRLGVVGFPSAHYVLSLFLKRHGMVESDVTVVEGVYGQLSGLLLRGEVDAIVDGLAIVRTPRWRITKAPGVEIVDLSEPSVCPIRLDLIASADLAKKNPGAIEKFTRAMVKAVTFMNEHRDEAQDLIAESLGLEGKRVREASEQIVFEVSLGPSLLASLDDEGRWYQSTHAADAGVPGYAGLVYRDALLKVSPGAVTLPR